MNFWAATGNSNIEERPYQNWLWTGDGTVPDGLLQIQGCTSELDPTDLLREWEIGSSALPRDLAEQ